MNRLFLMPLAISAMTLALAGCAVVGTAASVTGSVISTTVGVTGDVISGAARTVTGSGDHDHDD